MHTAAGNKAKEVPYRHALADNLREKAPHPASGNSTRGHKNMFEKFEDVLISA